MDGGRECSMRNNQGIVLIAQRFLPVIETGKGGLVWDNVQMEWLYGYPTE